MPKQVIMPQLGESVVEGTITRWLKAQGEQVDEYEALLEVNTDKVDTEVPSPASGVVLEILVPEGTVVQAGAVLAWIGMPGEAVPSGKPASVAETLVSPAEPVREGMPRESSVAAEMVVPDVNTARELGFISPVVKRMAHEHNIDLRRVPGSGLGGRITKQDVLDYMASQDISTPAIQATVLPLSTSASAYPVLQLPGDELLPLTAVRRTIAEHMVYSERTAPHVTTVMEADLSRVTAHRLANKDAFTRDGVNLTFTAYFVSATVTALKAYPMANSSWSDEGIRIHHTINIGIAASLGEAGLIVPVIKDAAGLSLLGLAKAINDLARRVRNRQLKPDDVRGGTFTITNHGTSGSLFAAPIINQPQCAILGVGVIQKRPVVITDDLGRDAITIRPMAYLSLTFDHRILDGALADAFLSKVVESLNNFG